MRRGDRVTVLVPHAAGLAPAWETGGVEVVSFRYAPAGAEVLGYGRSLEADVRVRGRAAAVAPLYLAAARLAVARRLRGRRFDLVHAHWIVPNGLAAAAALPRARAGTGGAPGPGTQEPGAQEPGAQGQGRQGPGRQGAGGPGPVLAIGLHGSDVFLAEQGGARQLARWALGRSALLTGCSPELVERVCALGFPAARSRVIPYGVDTVRFSPERGRRRVWRERLGIGEEAPLLLGVGRMAAKKGFGVLAAALPALLGALPELHVVLAGDGDLLPELAAATAAWRERVHLPGAVLRDTLPDLYRSADVFVLPAVHDERGNVDGLPNVILEAMASGLPVVASGISGVPLAVEDGASGLLVPERDAEALGAALRRLLAGGEEARRMGERGRRKAERELTWDVIAERHREAYELALGAGRSS